MGRGGGQQHAQGAENLLYGARRGRGPGPQPTPATKPPTVDLKARYDHARGLINLGDTKGATDALYELVIDEGMIVNEPPLADHVCQTLGREILGQQRQEHAQAEDLVVGICAGDASQALYEINLSQQKAWLTAAERWADYAAGLAPQVRPDRQTIQGIVRDTFYEIYAHHMAPVLAAGGAETLKAILGSDYERLRDRYTEKRFLDRSRDKELAELMPAASWEQALRRFFAASGPLCDADALRDCIEHQIRSENQT